MRIDTLPELAPFVLITLAALKYGRDIFAMALADRRTGTEPENKNAPPGDSEP